MRDWHPGYVLVVIVVVDIAVTSETHKRYNIIIVISLSHWRIQTATEMVWRQCVLFLCFVSSGDIIHWPFNPTIPMRVTIGWYTLTKFELCITSLFSLTRRKFLDLCRRTFDSGKSKMKSFNKQINDIATHCGLMWEVKGKSLTETEILRNIWCVLKNWLAANLVYFINYFLAFEIKATRSRAYLNRKQLNTSEKSKTIKNRWRKSDGLVPGYQQSVHVGRMCGKGGFEHGEGVQRWKWWLCDNDEQALCEMWRKRLTKCNRELILKTE